jgi:alkaline phosphatase
MQMPALIATLLGSGLLGIGAIALFEKLVPAVPSYALYVFLGMTIVPDGGALVLISLATCAGSTLGALCWYALGRALGARRTEAAIARFGRCIRLDMARYHRLTAAYRRHPFRVSLLGQITPVVRLYVPLPAGMLGLSPVCFVAATAVGSLIWNTPLLGFGYALRSGDHDPVVVGLAVVAGLVLLEAGVVVGLRLRRPAYPDKV